MAHVYGKFISDQPAQSGCLLEEMSEGACASALTLSRAEIAQRYSLEHCCLRIKVYGEMTGTCWLAPGAAYSFRSRRYQTGGSTCLAYELSYGPKAAEDPGLSDIVAALERFLAAKGKDRLVISFDQKLMRGQAEAAHLHPLGESRHGIQGAFILGGPAKSLPERVKSILKARLPLLSSAAYHVITALRPPAFVLSGMAGRRKAKALFLGADCYARFYSGLLFDPCDSFLAAPPGWEKGMDRVPSGFDLVITHGPCPKDAGSGEVVMPAFINSVLDAPPDKASFHGSLCNSAKSDIRKIAREGYSHEISESPLDLILFYHSMYKPMVDNRHKIRAARFDFSMLEEALSQGFILFAQKNGLCLGGMLVSMAGKRLRLRFLGVLDGSFAHTRSGVNAALMYFSILHAIGNGYSTIDFGQSAALKGDGVAWFKE
ncbi:MAG: hypothetical protein V1827_01875, partial [Candidatus Micrarchaeota archaeon]